jgi:hypothetical protein
VRPVGFVDDYVLQAGVPKSQIESLVDAFLRTEAALGPCPEDDTQALNAWEDHAVDLLPWTLMRARRTLRADETGYHALAFAKMRRGVEPGGQFEAGIASALTSPDLKLPGRASGIPTLSFQDDAIVLLAPSTSAVVVRAGAQDRTLDAGGRLILPTPLPDSVSWRPVEKRGDAAAARDIPVLGENRLLLAFDAATGRLVKAIGRTTETISLDAREIIVVGAESFQVDGDRAVELGRNTFALFVSLNETTTVTIAGRSVAIRPPARPVIDLDLPRIGRGPFGPLCGSPREVRIVFHGGRPEGQLELLIDHPALEKTSTQPLREGDNLSVDVSQLLPAHGQAGFLRLSVVFADGHRSLVRSTCWVWPGLSGLEQGIVLAAPAVPSNYVEQRSLHVVKSAGRLALEMDEHYRAASLAFAAGDGLLVSFEIPRPGLTLSLISDTGQERFVKEGVTLSAGSQSTDSLLIRNSDTEAALDVRGQIESQAFGRSGVRRIALAALAGTAIHDEIRLLPRSRPEASRVLVRVAPATAPVNFTLVKHPGNRLLVKLMLPDRIDAARLLATNLVSDDLIQATASFGQQPVDSSHGNLIEMRGGLGVGSAVEIILQQDKLSQGLWIGELQIRNEAIERWMPLANARADRYLFGLSTCLASIDHTGTGDDHVLFTRLTDALNRCVATECWELSISIEH